MTITAFAADSADSGPAIKAANAWIALVDAGNYAESWKQAAPLFQQQVTESYWEKAAGSVRGPLGKVLKRSAPTARYTTELPDAPTGQYWLVQDTADFEHQPGLTERVTVMQTSSGWQVIGYHID
ncbi:MAG TPA: DUF4019 domain-containing protein [Gammaproteobacteria bacterium]